MASIEELATLAEVVRGVAGRDTGWPELRAGLEPLGVLGLQAAGEVDAALVVGAALAATGSVVPGLELALEEVSADGASFGGAGARVDAVAGVVDRAGIATGGAGEPAARWWRGAAAACLGACRELQERAARYARERVVFGRPVGSFQVQRHRLAEIAARTAAVEALVAASAVGGIREAALALVAAADTARFVADETLQLHGGFGYAEESGIARWWRELHAVDALIAAPARAHLAAHPPCVPDPRPAARPDEPPMGQGASRALGAGGGLPERVRAVDVRAAWAARGRAFLAEHVVPCLEGWEAQGEFPRELFLRAGEAGLFGAKFAARWGGSGPDLLAQAAWVDVLARAGSGGLAADLGAHSDLACLYVDRAGTDEQRGRWLVPSLRGELIGALAVTEPDAGSDVAGITTRARRDGDGWRLDGAKTYITNGAWCDWVVVAAKTEPDSGHAGITLFVVEAGTPGFTRRRLRMLGWHTSHTGELAFDGVRLGDDARLGEVGHGFYAIMGNFDWERVSMALGAVAAADRSLAAAREAAAARPASEGWAPRIAAAEAAVAAGTALADAALRTHLTEAAAGDTAGGSASRPRPGAAVRTAAMAKLVTQRLAVRAAHLAYELDPHSPAERWLRDARLGPIGGGTDEIMRELIARTA